MRQRRISKASGHDDCHTVIVGHCPFTVGITQTVYRQSNCNQAGRMDNDNACIMVHGVPSLRQPADARECTNIIGLTNQQRCRQPEKLVLSISSASL